MTVHGHWPDRWRKLIVTSTLSALVSNTHPSHHWLSYLHVTNSVMSSKQMSSLSTETCALDIDKAVKQPVVFLTSGRLSKDCEFPQLVYSEQTCLPSDTSALYSSCAQ